MIYSKGIMWLDDCRIPFVDDKEKEGVCKSDKTKKEYIEGWDGIFNYKRTGGNTQGRFTPNLLVCDDMLNDGSVSKSSGNIRNNKKPQTIYGGGKGVPPIKVEGAPSDKGTNSRYYDLDLWFEKLINEI